MAPAFEINTGAQRAGLGGYSFNTSQSRSLSDLTPDGY